MTTPCKQDRSVRHRQGDCEGYAIAKYLALRETGMAFVDLQILMVKDKAAGNDHASLAVRTGGQWLILDNLRSWLLDENDAAFFKPWFALSGDSVMRFGSREEHIARLRMRDPT